MALFLGYTLSSNRSNFYVFQYLVLILKYVVNDEKNYTKKEFSLKVINLI